MNIRKASEKDLPDILRIIGAYPDTLLQSDLPPADSFFVAEEKGAIVGCCALEVYSERLAELRSLAIAKEFQGKGIATELIGTCVKKAKEARVRELLCITSAVELFEKHGFGTFKNEKFALLKFLRD